MHAARTPGSALPGAGGRLLSPGGRTPASRGEGRTEDSVPPRREQDETSEKELSEVEKSDSTEEGFKVMPRRRAPSSGGDWASGARTSGRGRNTDDSPPGPRGAEGQELGRGGGRGPRQRPPTRLRLPESSVLGGGEAEREATSLSEEINAENFRIWGRKQTSRNSGEFQTGGTQRDSHRGVAVRMSES